MSRNDGSSKLEKLEIKKTCGPQGTKLQVMTRESLREELWAQQKNSDEHAEINRFSLIAHHYLPFSHIAGALAVIESVDLTVV
jgi:hypothetical protein